MMPETVGISAGEAGDKDIVWTAWKHAAVHKRTVKKLRFLTNKTRSMASYGVCIGLIASIEKAMIQVTPSEVKVAATNKKTASKKEMIEWATGAYPDAGWFTKKQKGVVSFIDKNEHPADALAAIHAGAKTDQFKQLLAMQGFLL